MGGIAGHVGDRRARRRTLRASPLRGQAMSIAPKHIPNGLMRRISHDKADAVPAEVVFSRTRASAWRTSFRQRGAILEKDLD